MHTLRYLSRTWRVIAGVECCCFGSLTMTIHSGAQKDDQQLKKSLSSGAFKADLTQFLLKAWSNKEYASRLGKQALFVTAGDRCFRLEADYGMTDEIKADLAGLACTQEEADTSMLLHAAHTADSGAPAVVIKSSDSDGLSLPCRSVSRSTLN